MYVFRYNLDTSQGSTKGGKEEPKEILSACHRHTIAHQPPYGRLVVDIKIKPRWT